MSGSAHRRAHAAVETGRGIDDLELASLLRDSLAAVDRLLGGERATSDAPLSYERSYCGKLAVLRALMGLSHPRLRPVLDHRAPLGYAYASVEHALGLEPGGGVTVLESLADLGLLERELHACVQVCPRCAHFHVNYRETCVSCHSMNIEVERLIHHFHCAYIGLESEFQSGIDLVCPRCRKRLNQLGQDFETPSDTFVCHDCHRIFEEPTLQAVCVFCSNEFLGRDTELIKVNSYTPTPLTVRAVELNRLTGLDVSEIMFDSSVRMATQDFLAIEVEREMHRAQRYGSAFTCALLTFVAGEHQYAVFREWSVDSIRELGRMLNQSLRPLDLVARVGNERVGLLLPETDEEGALAVRDRLVEMLRTAALGTHDGRELHPDFQWLTCVGQDASKEEAMAFFQHGMDAR